MPDRENPSGSNAFVTYYGAVNAATRNSDGAIAFLKGIMNWSNPNITPQEFGKYPTFSVPANNAELLASISMRADLPKHLTQQMENALNGVVSFRIQNAAISDICTTAFLPYFRDEATYEDCFADMTAKLSIYLSE